MAEQPVRRRPPPPHVLAAFGVDAPPVPLPGGEGTAWLVGDLVLKPLEKLSSSVEEAEWKADVLESMGCDGFRVARPRRAADGSVVFDGWTASERLEGRHEERRWLDVIAVGERFHAALAGLARPGFLDARTDPWAIGDRVAWGERPVEDFLHDARVARLARALRPVELASQLVHGDLTGNVLFAEGLLPAVIDFAPYWRPPAFASTIVVGDALVWEGAGEDLVAAVAARIEGFEQLLVRALIYRAVTDWVFRRGDLPEPDPFVPAVEHAVRFAAAEV